ncbi:hypothetical protein [Vibrio vulnificus YJ016]|uniref:Uncharacterized protein n=1 Tax=Vibrio vulnificus (strain YJ016) TaxID=196600 RepID=Q7MMA7_VIBVY|nr:hypothetical protein [Vibrio vulnificus YJ016]
MVIVQFEITEFIDHRRLTWRDQRDFAGVACKDPTAFTFIKQIATGAEISRIRRDPHQVLK